jgi:hypothetical protein
MFIFIVFFIVFFSINFWFASWMEKRTGKEYAFWLTFFLGIHGAIFSFLLKIHDEQFKINK